MRHRKAKITLDRNAAQRRRLLRNMATALVLQERIVTTQAKAKAVRSLVERLITTGKISDIHHRRQILRRVPRADVAAKVIDVLGPRFKTRTGGYTRMSKLGPRAGDGASQVVLELVKE